MSSSRPPGGDAHTPASRRPLSLPARPSLEQLRKQAKDLLRDARAGEADALARLAPAQPRALGERAEKVAVGSRPSLRTGRRPNGLLLVTR